MKKDWTKHMLLFALLVLIVGIVFSLIVILGGINSSFESTQRTDETEALVCFEEMR